MDWKKAGSAYLLDLMVRMALFARSTADTGDGIFRD